MPNIAIAPIDGFPAPLDQQLADQIAQAAQSRDLAVTSLGASSSHAWLRGTVTSGTDDEQIQIDWVLLDAEGAELTRFSSTTSVFQPTAKDPWLRFANNDYANTIVLVASRLVSEFGPGSTPTQLAAENSSTASTSSSAREIAPASSSSSTPTLVHISQITGAPGDGETSLRDALSAILTDKRLVVPIQMAPAANTAQYLIDAQINLKTKSENAQTIRLNWRLLNPSGEVIGNVAQQNDIPIGSLNGPWNEVAFFAAEAAAEGLVNLLLLAEEAVP